MGKTSKTKPERRQMRPAISPEARENQLIALAIDVAEEQLRNGTASSQVITHYLKLGTMREKYELERLKEENKLIRAKTKAYENAEDVKLMYEEAIKAFREYGGGGVSEDDEED